MTDLALFREYEPHELDGDGYPRVWHHLPCNCCGPSLPAEARHSGTHAPECDSRRGVKDLVRFEAGDRCIRCGHPYREGEFTWEEQTRMEGPPPDVRELAGMPGANMSLIRAGRATHWSPCDNGCRHGAPVRTREHTDKWDGGWRCSWPTLAREALTISEPGHGAGALVRDGKDVEAAWRVLTVHHANGRKHDLRPFNLLSLCQRCHLYIQRTVILERVYPYEHEDWFKPFAAAWYAYAYEGRTIGLDEARADLDRLLKHERMA